MQTPTHINYHGISLFSNQLLIEHEFERTANRVKVLAHAEYPVVGAGFAVEIDFLQRICLRKNMNLPLIHNERFIDFKVTNWLNVILERGWGADGLFVNQPMTPIMLSTDRGPPVPMVVNLLPSGWATSVRHSASYSLTMPSLERQLISPDVVATPEHIALDSVQEMVGILYAVVSVMRSGNEELGCHLLEAAQERVTAIGEMMSTVRGHGAEAGTEEEYVEMQE
ncbi:hypothetical protein Hypma_008158 [Hypsizygus marmoreus]|uniref:Uncharacterized protein n=1 Tax=Hypsizygus marmoreus TaxID=39966 RepID=A0A369JQX9_HYPMA|nr:hypothetical protein Hypma_008158 [Hypsizygus marmoreus]